MEKLDPKTVDEWIAIISNRGAVVVIAAIVIALIAGFAYLFWKFIYGLLYDLLPEIKGWVVDSREATITNKETLNKLSDTMTHLTEDRRQCQINTKLALMNTDVQNLMAKGHPHEKEIEALNQQIKLEALTALAPPNQSRLGIT